MNHDINDKEWTGVCVVGIGEHAKNKIIPSLLNLSIPIRGLVSSKTRIFDNLYNIYPSISNAIINLPKNTLFILCSPPDVHFEQSMEILKSGFDLMIEKPAFINLRDFNFVSDFAISRNLILIEMMMYQFNKSCILSYKYLRKNIKNISSIETSFLIPKLDTLTYRNENKFSCSSLSDIGCYPLNFYSISGFPLDSISCTRRENNDKNIFYILNVEHKNIKISSKIGFSRNYSNYLKITLKDNSFFSISPFFFGRNFKKLFVYSLKKSIRRKLFAEDNAFDILFSKNRNYWLKNQIYRFQHMTNVLNAFEKIQKAVK